jgi:hypothetical protein
MSSLPRKQRKIIVNFLDEYLSENKDTLEAETFMALSLLMSEIRDWAQN